LRLHKQKMERSRSIQHVSDKQIKKELVYPVSPTFFLERELPEREQRERRCPLRADGTSKLIWTRDLLPHYWFIIKSYVLRDGPSSIEFGIVGCFFPTTRPHGFHVYSQIFIKILTLSALFLEQVAEDSLIIGAAYISIYHAELHTLLE